MTPDRTLLDSILKETRSGTVSRAPPKGFEPLKASAAELVRFGFPPEPDHPKMPERHAFWTKMLSGPLEFVPPEFGFPNEPELHRIAPRHQGGGGGPRRETSLNWSGAYIKPTHASRFTEIHGAWIVPTPSLPKGPKNQPLPSGSYRSTTFIGLDGQRRYFGSSLPQIGTASLIDVDAKGKTSKRTYAWWQWWVRGQHLPEHSITSVPVSPGETVLCSLVVISPTIVRLSLKNQETGKFFGPVDVPAPYADRPNLPRVQVKVTGATAEWITERPTSFDEKHSLYELPDYGEIRFSDCHAVSSSTGSAEQLQKLDLATLIKMRAIREHPHRSVPLSVAELEGEQGLTTTYLG